MEVGIGNNLYMNILAIDPGTTESAYVLMDAKTYILIECGKIPNSNLKDKLLLFKNREDLYLVIEMIKSYGMPLGDTCLETCVWIGRFIETWGRPYDLIPRKTVVTEICNNPRGNDSHVRQALINRYGALFPGGGGSKPSIGTKKAPGPLYEVKKDIWAALAVAMAWQDINARALLM